MTYREKIAQEHPEAISEHHLGGVVHCPYYWGYEKRENSYCFTKQSCNEPILAERCRVCWDREIREEEKCCRPNEE